MTFLGYSIFVESNFLHLSIVSFKIILQVTSFIREESRQNMQIIVISLKEEFFSKADALLGVYSDVTNFQNMLEVGGELFSSIVFIT